MHIRLINIKHNVLSSFLTQNVHQRKNYKRLVSNFTLLCTLQAEKYAPTGERFGFKCLVCKISAIRTETIEINYTMID